MKSKLLIIVVFAVFISLVFFIVPGDVGDSGSLAEHATDALRFKADYEALNDTESHRNIYIPEDNRIVYIEFDDLVNLFDSGTGILFFSRPQCPSCRILIPTLLQVSYDVDIDIHYYNITYDRDAHNERYIWMLETLNDYLPVDASNQHPDDPNFDESIKRVTVPHLFFVADGQIISEIMMNSHPLIVSEDFEGIYDLLHGKFLQVRQVLERNRGGCPVC